MQVIPVIDLKGGKVVHARRGDRDAYRPLVTPLSTTPQPLDVIAGLLGLHPFDTIYVADLDAISQTGDNLGSLSDVRRVFPDLRLWVDRGTSDPDRAECWLGSGIGDLVIGSESQPDTRTLDRLASHPHVLLSLDFRGDKFLGPKAILEDVSLWPQRVIVMTLSLVGSGAGPDLARLAGLRTRVPEKHLVAAGGVRHAADLDALAGLGISAALMATALHEGAIDRATLARISAETGSMVPPARS